MWKRHTSSGRVMRTIGTRRFSVATGGILAACLGLWLVAAASGAEAGAANYKQMATQTFSDEQWLQMLRQRVHQPMAVWYSVGTGVIEATGTSFSSSGLNFENSRSGVFEKQMQENGLLAKHPLVFLSLFDDQDPETVLTGAAAYVQAQFFGDVKPQALDKAVQAQIAAAVREKLLPHRDVRVRAAAIGILADTRWMMPEDIAKGMDDATNEIRIITVSEAATARNHWSWESDPDNTDEPNTPDRLTREQFHQREAQLVEILLAHLNDTHYKIRQDAADILRWAFMRRVNEWKEENPDKRPIERPRDFDWVRSDWGRRAGTQKGWMTWWKQFGAPKPKKP